MLVWLLPKQRYSHVLVQEDPSYLDLFSVGSQRPCGTGGWGEDRGRRDALINAFRRRPSRSEDAEAEIFAL